MVTSQDALASISASEAKSLTSMANRWHECERYERLNVPCPFRKAQMEEDDEPQRGKRIPVPRGVREPARPRKPSLQLPKLVGIPGRPNKPSGGGGPAARKRRIPASDLILLPVPWVPPVLVPHPTPGGGGRPARDPTRQPIPTLPDGIPGIIPSPGIEGGRQRAKTPARPVPFGGVPNRINPNLGGEPFPFQARAYNTLFNSKKPFTLPQQVPQRTGKLSTELTPSRIALMELWVTAAGLAEEIFAPHFAQAFPQSTSTGARPATNGRGSLEFDPPKKGVTARDVGKAAAAAGTIATGAAGIFKAIKGGGGGGFQFPSMPGDPSEGLFKAP